MRTGAARSSIRNGRVKFGVNPIRWTDGPPDFVPRAGCSPVRTPRAERTRVRSAAGGEHVEPVHPARSLRIDLEQQAPHVESRVVHKELQVPGAGDTFLHLPQISVLGQIRGQDLRLNPVARLELLRKLLEPVIPSGDQDQVIATGGQSPGIGRPDPAGSARHQRGPSDPVHRLLVNTERSSLFRGRRPPLPLPRARCRLSRPGGQFLVVLDDLLRNLVIRFEDLVPARREGAHAPVPVLFPSRLVGLEVETSVIEDAEEVRPQVEPVAAEHGPATYPLQGAQLVEHKISERVLFHSDGGLETGDGFHGRVHAANSDLPLSRWYVNEPRQNRPNTSAASAATSRACTTTAPATIPKIRSMPIANAKEPAIPWANRRGGGAGERRTVPGRDPRVRLYAASKGFQRGRSAPHQRIPDRTRKIAGDWRMTARRTIAPTTRGWNMRAEYRTLQDSSAVASSPCWRMKFRTESGFFADSIRRSLTRFDEPPTGLGSSPG